MRNVFCVLFLAGLLSVSVSSYAQEMENPWMKASEGSWVKHKNSTEMKAGGQVMNTENITTKTLTKKDDAGFTILVKTDVGGNVIENESTLPAKADYAKSGTKVETKEVGSETITVGGKSYDCKVTETTLDIGGKKTVTTLWSCDEVPSGAVKSVTKNEMMTSTVELIDFGSK